MELEEELKEMAVNDAFSEFRSEEKKGNENIFGEADGINS